MIIRTPSIGRTPHNGLPLEGEEVLPPRKDAFFAFLFEVVADGGHSLVFVRNKAQMQGIQGAGNGSGNGELMCQFVPAFLGGVACDSMRFVLSEEFKIRLRVMGEPSFPILQQLRQVFALEGVVEPRHPTGLLGFVGGRGRRVQRLGTAVQKFYQQLHWMDKIMKVNICNGMGLGDVGLRERQRDCWRQLKLKGELRMFGKRKEAERKGAMQWQGRQEGMG